jgi:hypothetical protein
MSYLMNVVANKNFNSSNKPKHNWLHKKQNYAAKGRIVQL